MKFLTQSEKQAVSEFLGFLSTKEAWHIPSLMAHLSCCGSRLSVLNELANQVEIDIDQFPPKDAIFSFLAVGDLYSPTLCFDHVRNEIVFSCEGDMRDELESYGYVADPNYPIGIPLPCVLSEGTCKLSDILPVLFDALKSYDPDKANEIALELYKGRVDLSDEDLDPEEQDFWYSEIEEAINSASCIEKEGLYCGTHDFDPACVGIWRVEEEQDEDQDEDQDDSK